MRILMVLGESTGGIGGHVDRLSQDLRAAGHDVQVATSAATAAAFQWGDAHPLWPVHRGWSAPRGLVDWHLLKNLAGTVDVVHAHGHQAAVVAAVAVARAKPRPALVISLHNTLPPSLVAGADRMPLGPSRARASVAGVARSSIRWALRRAALVTGASADLVELAEQLGAHRATLATVPSPAVEQLLATPTPSEAARRETRRALREQGHDLDETRPLVLTVARLAPQKDLPSLVAAARSVRTPASWVVVGGGDERLRASLESELSGIPLRLVGPQRDVARWLRAADVFVLPSRWEARALVVQEAMAAGLPVVTTRTGGLPDLVGDAGLLVPVGDPGSLAAAVEHLLSDGPLRRRLGEAARARARAWATPEEEARRWVSRYTEALRG
ncbi:glycosyltransferase family 4 protein [Intrasporangium calvum]|uniref:glycosyltransferase family 4 protein n=1 Tax=Intrasporangium calvum TaxID=53358 RepID=UPI0002FB7FCC|nr:glycosyltransferase family 4 protein [Intrasporangium calvum]